MKKILFPTEFSDHAADVFRYAVELAYFFKARLVVMHAFGKPDLELTVEEELEQMADIVTDSMIKFVLKNMPDEYRPHIHIDYVARIDFPTEAILGAALDEDIDLIVMGMTGKTNALDTLFGSTALEVLAKADCPVLVVPDGAKFKGIENLAYTTNFEFRDLGAINFLKKWLNTFDASLHCLHIVEPKENELSAIKNLNILKATFQGRKRILFDLTQGDFQEEIERFANRKQADIVAMMFHKRNYILRLIQRSAVTGVARRIHLPLLVIKDNAYEKENEMTEFLSIANSIG